MVRWPSRVPSCWDLALSPRSQAVSDQRTLRLSRGTQGNGMTKYHHIWRKTKGIFFIQNPHDLPKRPLSSHFEILWGKVTVPARVFGRWKDMLIQRHAGACWNDFLMDALFQWFNELRCSQQGHSIRLASWLSNSGQTLKSLVFPGLSQVSCWKSPTAARPSVICNCNIWRGWTLSLKLLGWCAFGCTSL